MRNKVSTKLVAVALATAFAMSGVLGNHIVASAANIETATVSTQKELKKALQNKKITKIVIKTPKSKSFTIEATNHKIDVVVNAPNATVTNKTDVDSIKIQDAKSFTEKGKNNNITVTDRNSLMVKIAKDVVNTGVHVRSNGGNIQIKDNGDLDNLTIEKKSTVTVSGKPKTTPNVTVSGKNARLSMSTIGTVALQAKSTFTTKPGADIRSLTIADDATVNVLDGSNVDQVSLNGNSKDVTIMIDGTVASVDVDSKAKLQLSGSTATVSEVNMNTGGSSLVTAIKTNAIVYSDSEITFNSGADGSTMSKASNTAKVSVKNATTADIKISDSKGNSSVIKAGATDTNAGVMTSPSKNDTTSSSGGGSSSSGGGSSSSSSSGGNSSTTPVSKLDVSVSSSAGTDPVKELILPGTTLTVSAKANLATTGAINYDYVWYAGDEKISTASAITVSRSEAGKQISVVTTATAGTLKEVKEVKLNTVAYMVHPEDIFSDITVDSEDPYDAQLPTSVGLIDESNSKIATASISWGDYDQVSENTYTFTGKLTCDNAMCVLTTDTVKITVVTSTYVESAVHVVSAEAISYTGNTNLRSNAAATEVSYRDFNVTLKANYYGLTIFDLGDLGTGRWVPVKVVFDKPVNDIVFDGGKTTIAESGEYARVVACDDNSVVFLIDVTSAYDKPVVFSTKCGDGQETDLQFNINAIASEATLKDSVQDVSIDWKEDLDFLSVLPKELTFTVNGVDVTASITWEFPYGKTDSAGTYTARCLVTDKRITCNDTIEIKLIVKRIACETPTPDATVSAVQNGKVTITADTALETAMVKLSDGDEIDSVEDAESYIHDWSAITTLEGFDEFGRYLVAWRIPSTSTHLASEPKYTILTYAEAVSEVPLSSTDDKNYITSGKVTTDVETNELSGDITVHYATGVTAFSDKDKAYSHGFYIPLTFELPDANLADTYTIKSSVGDVVEVGHNDTTVNLLGRINSAAIDGAATLQFTLDLDGDADTYDPVTYTLSSDSVTVEECAVNAFDVYSLTKPSAVSTDSESEAYLKFDPDSLIGSEAYENLNVEINEDTKSVVVTGTVTKEQAATDHDIAMFFAIDNDDFCGYSFNFTQPSGIGYTAVFDEDISDNREYGKLIDGKLYAVVRFALTRDGKVVSKSTSTITTRMRDVTNSIYNATVYSLTLDISGVTVAAGE